MVNGSPIETLKALLGRMSALVEGVPAQGWQLEWDILKNDIWDFCQKAFVKGSTEYKVINSALHPRSRYIYGGEVQNFYDNFGDTVPRALQLVMHRLEQGQAVTPQTRSDEHLIGAGTPHSAYVLLRDIVRSASGQILIVDPYVDGTLLSLLSNAGATVGTRILTRQKNLPKDFGEELRRFVRENALTIEVRLGLGDLHDRFIVVDERLFFSGASFKDLGTKGSLVAEMTGIQGQTIAHLEDLWATATLLK